MRCPRMSLWSNEGGITSLSEIRRVGGVVDHITNHLFLRLASLFLFQSSSQKAIWNSVMWMSLFCDAMAPIEPSGNLHLSTQSVFCNTFAPVKEFSFLMLELSFFLLGL
jgi:hypothetical protein